MRAILLTMWSIALAAGAASIDGKWTAQMEMRGRGGNAGQKVELTLDLKSAGEQLTGTVSMSTPRGTRDNPISEGKVEGDKFSFTTVQKNPQGEVKIKWTGTVSGDELKGERSREGGDRGIPFTAKRRTN